MNKLYTTSPVECDVPKQSDIGRVSAVIERAQAALASVNDLADRLAGPRPPETGGASDGTPVSHFGVIPALGCSASQLDADIDRAMDSLGRIERLI